MKSKNNIIFRADADKQIGYGHFVRSLALAEMLKDDFNCYYATVQPTDFQLSEIAKVCNYLPIPAYSNHFDSFLSLLAGDEIVVLDNYFFSSEYQYLIKQKGCKLVCLGTNDKYYYADLLINFVIYDERKFLTEPYTQFCLGLEWAILRKSFRADRKSISGTKKNKIVVCFGGTDQFKLTERVVDVLLKQNCENINVISTDALGVARIEALCSKSVRVHINISEWDVCDLLLSSNLAILSTSTIVLEALACKTSVIAGYYVDNQINMYNALEEKRYILGLGNLLEDTMEQKLVKKMNSSDFSFLDNPILDFSNLQSKYIEQFKTLCY